jgi:curved DNA-binding protein CbpA
MVDFYEVLQVSPRAEADVVRAAFRALARKHHPDFGGDPRRMMALADAWRVLGDPKARAAYDAKRAAQRSITVDVRPTGHEAPAPPRACDVPRTPRSSGGETTLDFGRYTGWTLRALVAVDPDYLEWLKRTPIGRPFRAEIETYQNEQRPSRPVMAPVARASRLRRPVFSRA